jgi:hypothetical protein
LEKDDAGLLSDIQAILSVHALGDPYSEDGAFALNLASLPPWLRAMAATHWLDISLTLDSITWHFGNFGETHLVSETEAGLRELGLQELAVCFSEAKELMVPLLIGRTEADGDFNDIVERHGVEKAVEDIDGRAWALADIGPGRSVIYEAWIRYPRQHPESVFGVDHKGLMSKE